MCVVLSPSNMRLRALEGFHADMAASDTLHSLWLGGAKDAVGSILLDVVEFHDSFAACTEYDEALQNLCAMFHEWCTEKGLERSVVDELSLTKLSVTTITFDFPIGLSKGYGNKLLLAFLADFLRATSNQKLQIHAVLCWAITEFARILENAGLWLTEGEAASVVDFGLFTHTSFFCFITLSFCGFSL